MGELLPLNSKTENCLNILPLPFPSDLLSLKYKKVLFLNAVCTTVNYLGRPTDSCKADSIDLARFVGELFNDCQIDKNEIYAKAKTLPVPKFKVDVEIRKAVLEPDLFLRENDTIFCKVGTSADDMKRTSTVKVHTSQWKKEFSFLPACHGMTVNSFIIVEMWLERYKRKPILIGKAQQDIAYLPCSANEITLPLNPHCDPNLKYGYIKLNCLYEVAEPFSKINTVHSHLLLCYMCFEYQLKGAQKLAFDETACACFPKRLYGCSLQRIFPTHIVTFLHQHALQSGISPLEHIKCCFIVASQHFIQTKRVSLDVVHALLYDMTALSSCIQKAAMPELVNTIKERIYVSIKECSKILYWTLPQSNDEKDADEKTLIKYLCHVQQYYNEEAVQILIKDIEVNIFEPDRPPSDSFELSPEFLENEIKEALVKLHCVTNMLRAVEEMYYIEFETSYVRTIHEWLNVKLFHVLKPLMNASSNDLDRLSFGAINLFLQLYFSLSKLLSFAGISYDHCISPLEIVDYHLWIQSKVFLSYMKILSDIEEPFIIAWIKNASFAEDETPFNKFTENLLKNWEKIINYELEKVIHYEPEPATRALIQVYYDKCELFYELLESNIKIEICFPFEQQFKLTSEVCSYLNKMANITECTDLVMQRIQANEQIQDHDILGRELEIWFLKCPTVEMLCDSLRLRIEEEIQNFLLAINEENEENGFVAKGELENFLRKIIQTAGYKLSLEAKKSFFKMISSVLEQEEEALRKVENHSLYEIILFLQSYGKNADLLGDAFV